METKRADSDWYFFPANKMSESVSSGGSRISQRWGRQPSRGTNIQLCQIFPWNWKNWDPERSTRPSFYYVDPPLVSICFTNNQLSVSDSFQSGCANLLFCNFFAENCMKMKEGASLAPPLDHPMFMFNIFENNICNYFDHSTLLVYCLKYSNYLQWSSVHRFPMVDFYCWYSDIIIA